MFLSLLYNILQLVILKISHILLYLFLFLYQSNVFYLLIYIQQV